MTRFEAPRGTHDILPSEQPLWEWVTGEMKDVARSYGYRRIDTPGFEDTDLIVRTSGGGSDVVQKETYTFTDRGGRSLTLRPEATAPICRAYVQHGLQREPQPQKLYTIGPMWRYDRPQRGRYREHWQLSIEAIGTDDPAIDAEVIQLYAELLRRVGVTDYVLELNSIGDQNCRPAYIEQLAAWLDEHEQELDDEARAKRATSPLRVFDVKSERVQALLAGAPKIGESLCDACREHFEQVREYLDAYGVALRAHPDPRPWPRLLHAHDIRVQGRGNRSEGHDLRRWPLRRADRSDRRPADAGHRLWCRHRAPPALDRRGSAPRPRTPTSSSCSRRVRDRARVLPLLAELRRRGLRADMDYAGRSVKGQLTQAGRLGAGWTVIVNGGRGNGPRVGPPRRDSVPRRARGQDLRMNPWRDLYAGDVRPDHVGQELTVAGWVARRRDHGGLIFIDLRDHTGIVQLVVNPERAPEAAQTAHDIRSEFVVLRRAKSCAGRPTP